MKVYALWFGGSSYAVPSIPKDVEEFRSLGQAKRVFDCRYANCEYKTPCVTDESEMQVFFSDPRNYIGAEPQPDMYPDRIIKRGKRGGIVVEKC